MESNLAIRYRNKIGNICPDCQAEIRKTKQGRWRLFFWNALYCLRFLALFALPFITLVVVLALYVL